VLKLKIAEDKKNALNYKWIFGIILLFHVHSAHLINDKQIMYIYTNRLITNLSFFRLLSSLIPYRISSPFSRSLKVSPPPPIIFFPLSENYSSLIHVFYSLLLFFFFLSCPPRPQLEKLVPYIPANMYGGNRPSQHPMLKQK
jgi:hypothetical protein